MKISWGIRIAFIYSLFVVIILAVVIFSMGQEVNLVTEDYYEEEIEYQNQIDKIKRTKLLPKQVQFNVKEQIVELEFPNLFQAADIKGDITFYRPSNSKKDVSYSIQLNSKMAQAISRKNIEKGLWRIKVNWSADSENYFSETVIILD